MVRRMGMLSAGLAILAIGTGGAPSGAQATETDKSWCMTYCDTIEIACRKTVGLLDKDACGEWHEGCLDGCRVNG